MIFISYRRADSRDFSARLARELRTRLGNRSVFFDVEDIDIGEDYVRKIEKNVRSCKVFLAVIGEKWLNIQGKDGKRRLEHERDPVRREIEVALALNKRIIPVLPVGVDMPQRADLPESLGDLARQNRVVLDHETFALDVERMVATFPAWWRWREFVKPWTLKAAAAALGLIVLVIVIGQFIATEPPKSAECDWQPVAASEDRVYDVPGAGPAADVSYSLNDDPPVGELRDAVTWRRAVAAEGGWKFPLEPGERPPCGIVKVQVRRSTEDLYGHILLDENRTNVELHQPNTGVELLAVKGWVKEPPEAGQAEGKPVQQARVKLEDKKQAFVDYDCTGSGGEYRFARRWKAEDKVELEAQKGACISVRQTYIVGSREPSLYLTTQ